jgi:hypothetical protein
MLATLPPVWHTATGLFILFIADADFNYRHIARCTHCDRITSSGYKHVDTDEVICLSCF